MAKSKKEVVQPQEELKSKVLQKDRKFVRLLVGKDNILASLQIYYVLECIYEKSNKRAQWENFYKKWRPTVLKMEGCHMGDLEEEILGK